MGQSFEPGEVFYQPGMSEYYVVGHECQLIPVSGPATATEVNHKRRDLKKVLSLENLPPFFRVQARGLITTAIRNYDRLEHPEI